jgi:hypothetical protein
MSIVLIVIYCLTAAVIIFGLTFQNELLDEKQRQRRQSPKVISIEAGRRKAARLRRRA